MTGHSEELGARQSRAAPAEKVILADCCLVHEMAAAAAKASRLTDGVLVLCSFSEDGGPPKSERFNIGDAEAMARTMCAWTKEEGRNTYRGLAVMRADLKGNERGRLNDVVAVFGVCGDLDGDKGCTMRPEDLPLQPSLVVRNISHPVKKSTSDILLFPRSDGRGGTADCLGALSFGQ
jgi:hypothetical protein